MMRGLYRHEYGLEKTIVDSPCVARILGPRHGSPDWISEAEKAS